MVLSALLMSSLAFGQITADPEERRNQGQEPLRTQTPEGRPLPFSQRLRFGGGISNLQFSTGVFGIAVSPVVAYQASERAIIGVGATYGYAHYKAYYSNYNTPTTYNQYGGRVFAMYEFIPALVPNLYLHGEIETSAVQQKVDGGGSYTGSVTAPLVGVTYMQPISRRFGVNLTALYNLNYTANSGLSSYVYGSPFVIRLSFF